MWMVFHGLSLSFYCKIKAFWLVIWIFQDVMSSIGKCLPLKNIPIWKVTYRTIVTLISSSFAANLNVKTKKPRHWCTHATPDFDTQTQPLLKWRAKCANNFPTHIHAHTHLHPENHSKHSHFEWIHLYEFSICKRQTDVVHICIWGRHKWWFFWLGKLNAVPAKSDVNTDRSCARFGFE